MNIPWKRWAAGAAGLLAAYTVAGFWLVQLVIKNQVPKFGQTELARRYCVRLKSSRRPSKNRAKR